MSNRATVEAYFAAFNADRCTVEGRLGDGRPVGFAAVDVCDGVIVLGNWFDTRTVARMVRAT